MFLNYGNGQGTKIVLKFPKFSNFLLLNANFSFAKRYGPKKTIYLTTFSKQIDFGIFWVKFLICSDYHNDLFYFFVKSPKAVEGFVYSHDGSRTSKIRAMRA